MWDLWGWGVGGLPSQVLKSNNQYESPFETPPLHSWVAHRPAGSGRRADPSARYMFCFWCVVARPNRTIHIPAFLPGCSRRTFFGLLATTFAIAVAYYGAIVSFRMGLDPDNFGIPLVTSSIDLMGSVSFIIAVAIFVTTGEVP